MAIPKRTPRNWRKYWHSYLAHALQGAMTFGALVFIHPALPFVLYALYYALYQVANHWRATNARDSYIAQIPLVQDNVSIDIQDFMIGGWIGLAIACIYLLLV